MYIAIDVSSYHDVDYDYDRNSLDPLLVTCLEYIYLEIVKLLKIEIIGQIYYFQQLFNLVDIEFRGNITEFEANFAMFEI